MVITDENNYPVNIHQPTENQPAFNTCMGGKFWENYFKVDGDISHVIDVT